jgi:Ran GTPase-activating protein (RanGAP) involved in mRNA processing and transport
MPVQLIDLKAKNLNSDLVASLIGTVLANAPLDTLFALNLTAARFANKALASLFTLLESHRIQTLNLSLCNLSQPESFAALIGFIKKNPELSHLDLSHNQLTNAQFGELLDALKENNQLESLSLQFNSLDAGILETLKNQQFKHPTQKSIDLTDNDLSTQELASAQAALSKLTFGKTKRSKALFYQPANLPTLPTDLHNIVLKLMEPASYGSNSSLS